jgi:chromosome segregation ATPase
MTSSDPSLGLDISLPEDKIKILESEKRTMELHLSNRAEMMSCITQECETVRKSLVEMNQKYEDEKRRTKVLTRDMTRQYKGMQDELLRKINERERMIQDLTDSLNELKADCERRIIQKERMMAEKDNCINRMKTEMDQMCQEFSSMLQSCNTKLRQLEKAAIQDDSLEKQMTMLTHEMMKSHCVSKQM